MNDIRSGSIPARRVRRGTTEAAGKRRSSTVRVVLAAPGQRPRARPLAVAMAFDEGVQSALRDHAAAGNAMTVYRGGRLLRAVPVRRSGRCVVLDRTSYA